MFVQIEYQCPVTNSILTASSRHRVEDWEGEKLLDIDDPHLPDALRDHAKRFKNPGKVVIEVGNGEYALYAQDGELLDLCFIS